MPKWFPSWAQNDEQDDEDKDKNKKVALPPELEAKFKPIDDLKADVTKINEKLASLDSITAFIEEQKADKLKQKADAEAAAKRKKEEKDEVSDEDMAALLLSDPKKAISDMTSPLTQAILETRADNIRRQVFEDRASEFEYYTGDIKKEVDQVIASQDLKFRNNAASLENAYHTVLGRKMKEINEGKIKSRFAQASGGQSSGQQGKKENEEIELTPAMIKAAKLSGIPDEEFRKMVKKAADAGELEYV